MSKKIPELTITITGDIATGKTTLASKLAIMLSEEDHIVTLLDEHGTKLRPDAHAVARFTTPRRITVGVLDYRNDLLRTCVHCGCNDMRACEGGCHWVEIHRATPTGVCSSCATPGLLRRSGKSAIRNPKSKIK